MLRSGGVEILAGFALMMSLLPCAMADVRLPHVLGSNMVLQRDMATPVWGWAAPGEAVTVGIAGQEVKSVADAQGRWLARLAPVAAGGPYEMTVRGRNEIKLTNILFGDVWLCSGQSNMRWELMASATGKDALAKADLPQVRLFYVPLRAAGQPVEDVASEWKVCSAATAARFTAVGFFFGREINKEIGVPIGLIDSAWSGSRIDPWIAPEGFASIPGWPDMTRRYAASRERWKAELLPWAIGKGPEAAALREALEKGTPLPITPAWPIDSKEMNRRHQYTAGREAEIYNGMIRPLVPFGLRGVLWYQGEGNVRAWPLIDYALPDGGMTYVEKTRALLNGWRKVWGQGDFPFYYVQLCPNRAHYRDDDLPRFWEQQTAILSAIPGTGMAVTTDVGALENIHPPRKEEVGKRLALWALAKTYGRDVVFSGPLYKSMSVEGNMIRLKFDHAAGLATRDGNAPDWFTIAGEDRKFVAANARIDGETVLVWSDAAPKPAAARLGWSNTATPNLVNGAGLPASPFRTDRWDPPPPVHKAAAEAAEESAAFMAANARRPGVVVLPDGVQYLILKPGDGPVPGPNNQISLVYRATFIDGTEFDSVPETEPATPRPQDVMAAIQETMKEMKVGSKWRVFIPPEQAYGATGFGPRIGPNAVLIYDLELRKILR